MTGIGGGGGSGGGEGSGRETGIVKREKMNQHLIRT